MLRFQDFFFGSIVKKKFLFSFFLFSLYTYLGNLSLGALLFQLISNFLVSRSKCFAVTAPRRIKLNHDTWISFDKGIKFGSARETDHIAVRLRLVSFGCSVVAFIGDDRAHAKQKKKYGSEGRASDRQLKHIWLAQSQFVVLALSNESINFLKSFYFISRKASLVILFSILTHHHITLRKRIIKLSKIKIKSKNSFITLLQSTSRLLC